jgi:hypothetical protein
VPSLLLPSRSVKRGKRGFKNFNEPSILVYHSATCKVREEGGGRREEGGGGRRREEEGGGGRREE